MQRIKCKREEKCKKMKGGREINRDKKKKEEKCKKRKKKK